MKLVRFLSRLGNDNTGATAVEYGLIVSLIVIAMVGALQSVANSTTNTWDRVEAKSVEAMNK